MSHQHVSCLPRAERVSARKWWWISKVYGGASQMSQIIAGMRALLCQVHAASQRPQILKAAFLFYVFRNIIKLLVVRERIAVQVGAGVPGNSTFLVKEFYLSCWITKMVLTTDDGGWEAGRLPGQAIGPIDAHANKNSLSQSGQPDTHIFGLWEETGKAQKSPSWILLLSLIFYPLQPQSFC